MSSEHRKERSRAIELVASHGWRPVNLNKKGYTEMLCGCGRHRMWLPATPSNRTTYRRKAQRMIKVCSKVGEP